MSASPVILSGPGTCVSCGAALQGSYCHSCGEKRLDRHDYALDHFLEHAVDTVTHFDLKVVEGIWSLLRHPGRMTRDMLAGRRVPWPKPLQLFLIVSLLFAFVVHWQGLRVFNTPWRYHQDQWYGPWAQTLPTIWRRGVTGLALMDEFNRLANVLSKTLIFLLIPLLGMLLALVLWRQRRYFLEHVISATHYLSCSALQCCCSSYSLYWT
ncbi:MAG: DUF3667 domain-containing protein [Hymenobacter sp.]|nr:DUF3667 domain-containing protein [Hymenobacter sp.]